jgi:hypothetical protein
MALYELTDQTGNRVQVEGPSGATKEQIVQLYNNTMAEQERAPERRLRAGLEKYYGTQQELAGNIARGRRPTFGDYLGEVPKGLIGGAAGMVETGALGLAALLPEGAEDVVRGGIKAVGGAVQDYVAPDFNLEESIPRKVSEATGSFAGLAATTMINPAAGVGLAVAAGAGEASERARAEGASVEDRNLSALLGIIPGALELLPIKFLSVINKAQKQKITDALARIVEQGGIEAGQEAVSSVAQNLIAREVYKPEQSLVEGTGEEAALGATVGAIIQGTLELVTPRTRGGTTSGADTGSQGELFPGEDLGQAPQRQEPTSEQGELFPDEDLGQAPEGPDPRQGDLFSQPEETLARRAKELEREKEMVMRRPMGEAIAEFEAKDDKFFERNKRERDAARRGIASLEAAKQRPAADTRDMRDMVAESQDQVADEQAREREGLRAAQRDDVAAFEQPDLFAQEIERERRRLGPEELRDPEQYMDATLFEEAEAPEFVRPAAERDLVDMIGEDVTATASAAVRKGREGAAEQDLENRQALAARAKAESAAETAQGKLDADRAAQTEATRTKVLQDTVANAGEVRRPEALRNLYETALTNAGLANAKATPQEMESLRRASDVIRAKDPTVEAISAREEAKDPRQLEMEARVAPKGITPLRAAAIIPEAIGEPLTPPERKANANVKGLDPAASRTGPAGDRPSGADRGDGTVRRAGEPAAPDDSGVGPALPSDGVTGDGTKPSSDTLTDADVTQRQMKLPRAQKDALLKFLDTDLDGLIDLTVDNPSRVNTAIDSVVAAATKPTIKKATAKPVTQTQGTTDAGGTRNTVGGKTIPAGAKRGPIPAGIKGVARPKKAESEAEQVARLYEEETPAVVKEAFGGKQEVPTTNPLSDADNKKIKDKILAGFSKSDKSKKEVAPIVAYLRAYPNPFDGLSMALFDQINGTPLATNESTNDNTARAAVEARQFMGGIPAKKGQVSPANRAIAWARVNLSKEANEKLDRRAKEIQLNQIRAVVFEGGPDRVVSARDKKLLQNRKSLEAAIVGGYADPKELVKDFPDVYPDVAAVREAMEDPAFGRMALDLGAIVGLDLPLHPTVEDAVKKGDMGDVLSNIALTNPVRQVRQTANAFLKIVGDTKVVVKKNLKAEDGRSVAGLFDPKTNTISLDADAGINTHTILHEMSHAGMSAALADPKNGFAIQLKKLFKDLDGYLGSAYGAQNVDEFLAEVQSNPRFRSDLASINMKGEEVTALQRFFNIANNFLSKFLPFVKSRNITALQEVDALVDGLLAPAPKYRNANQMAMMSTPEGVKKFAKATVQATKKSIDAESRQQFKYNARDFLSQGFSKKSKNLLLKLTGSQGLGDIAQAVGLGRMGYKLDELVSNQRGEIQTANKMIEDKIGKILTKLNKGTPEAAQKRTEALNRLIYDNDYGATIYQVDPTKLIGTYINKDGSPRMDKDRNDLLEVWKKQREDWKALGSDGQAVYNEMRAVYKDQYEKLKAVILKQIDELVQNPDDAAKLKKDIFAKLFDSSTLDVYFPLMRDGDYVLRYEVKNPKSSREATVVQTFTTAAERDDAAKMYRANKDYKNVEFVEEITANTFKGTGTDPSFAYDTLSILDKNKVPQDVKDQVLKLFINSLPETSFARSLQKRKGTPGYMQDSVYALKTKGYAIASQTVKLKYGALLRQYSNDLDAFERLAVPEAKSFVGKRTQQLTAAYEDVVAELKDRAQFAQVGAKNGDIEAIAKRLNQTAFIYTIGFNASSALVNLSQIPLFVAPFLGGKYGYTKTYKAIKAAYGNTLLGGKRGGSINSILDFYDISDKGNFTLKKGLKLPEGKEVELRNMEALVQTASNRGLLGQGFLAEAMGLNEASRIKKGNMAGNALDNASILSAWLFNHAEQLNRQVTLMASFNLALDSVTKGKPNSASAAQIEKAVSMAIFDTQRTNGGTFLETAPSIARENVGRVALMYKNYGLQMYTTMLKTAKTAMDSDKGALFGKEGSPERKAAVKQLIGMHGSALFFAGIQGLPLYGAVRLIVNLVFLDDEEEDFDTLVRQYMGEGWYKGAITEFAGIDVASRMALTGLLIQENRFNNDPSLEETIGFYLGGPALSVGNRLYRGFSDLFSSEGDTQRGIENIMPAGVANAYKSTFGRYAQQGGIYTRRNDPIYDDMTGGELVAQALGFPPTEYTFRQEQNSVTKRIDIAVGKRRSALHKKLYIAQRMGDFDAEMEIYDEIDKFNARHPEAEINAKSIERSLKQHEKTSAEMYNGVTLSPLYRDALEMIRDSYKQ